MLRATTLADAKLCKIEKCAHFTHFEQKNTHISRCKIVHLCTIATVTVHICTVIVACAFVIILIFVPTFFSLFSLHSQRTQFSSSFSYFSDAHKQTHPHPHPRTNKPTRTNQQRGRSELVGFERCLIGARGS